jgi:shikimate kinase
MNIFLIGFRCCGKTTVGKRLQELLSREFIDADDYLENKFQVSIKDIFDMKGESYFRMLESDVISELSKLDGKIIATGGGAVLKYKNIHNLKRSGVIILLDVDAETVFQRMKGQDNVSKQRRPRFSDKELFEEIKDQLRIRRPYYENTADYIVNTVGRDVNEVITEIEAFLREQMLW